MFFFSSLYIRTMQEVHLSKQVKLIDSPGVVASPSNPQVSLTLRSLQVEEGHLSVLDAARTLLKQCDQSQVGAAGTAEQPGAWRWQEVLAWRRFSFQIMLQYNVSDFRNSLEFLTLFAKKRGYLQKGGVPNTEQAAVTFLSDWTGWVSARAGAERWRGNEDRSRSLNLILKTYNPTLI